MCVVEGKCVFDSFATARGCTIVELGAGTGLASVVTARCGGLPVYSTDTGAEVLANMQANVEMNGVDVRVRALDWTDARTWPWGCTDQQARGQDARDECKEPVKVAAGDQPGSRTETSVEWTKEERENLPRTPLVLLSADGESMCVCETV